MAEVSGKTGKHVWAFTETNYQASPAYINIATGAQGSIAGLRIAIRAQGSDVRSEIFVPLNDVRQMLDLIMANIPFPDAVWRRLEKLALETPGRMVRWDDVIAALRGPAV